MGVGGVDYNTSSISLSRTSVLCCEGKKNERQIARTLKSRVTSRWMMVQPLRERRLLDRNGNDSTLVHPNGGYFKGQGERTVVLNEILPMS